MTTGAVTGAGAVGLAAVMAARVAGCTTIVAVDLHDSRLELARETRCHPHRSTPGRPTWPTSCRAITGGEGVNYVLDTTGVPAVVSGAAGALSIRGTLAVVAAAAPGTKAAIDIDVPSLVKGWTFKTIVQGSSVPQVFIPRLVELWKQGRFPVDKLVKTYKLDDINTAFNDSESGATVKPVVVFSDPTCRPAAQISSGDRVIVSSRVRKPIGQLHARVHAELRVDVADVELDRLDTDGHIRGDVAVAHARDDTPGDGELLTSESARFPGAPPGPDAPEAPEFQVAALDVGTGAEGVEALAGVVQLGGRLSPAAAAPQHLPVGQLEQRSLERQRHSVELVGVELVEAVPERGLGGVHPPGRRLQTPAHPCQPRDGRAALALRGQLLVRSEELRGVAEPPDADQRVGVEMLPRPEAGFVDPLPGLDRPHGCEGPQHALVVAARPRRLRGGQGGRHDHQLVVAAIRHGPLRVRLRGRPLPTARRHADGHPAGQRPEQEAAGGGNRRRNQARRVLRAITAGAAGRMQDRDYLTLLERSRLGR